MGRLMTVVAMALVLLGLCAEAVEGADVPGFVDEQGRGCSDWATTIATLLLASSSTSHPAKQPSSKTALRRATRLLY